MGGADKALLMLCGQTLIERAIDRARPQVGELLINAGGNLARFAKFGHTVIEDRMGGFLGPLAGILSGLEWMREQRPKAQWLASFACDTPFFPRDVVTRLIDEAKAERALVSIAASGGRRHNIFAVWSAGILESSQSVLGKQGLRKMDDFVARLRHKNVEFPIEPFDPFFNINTPGDLARAEALMAGEQTIR
jgi:molybdenum cofactor guanylyltransferase